MNRALMYGLALPLLAAEIYAQFVARDQRWATACCLLLLAVVAVRWAVGPQTEAEAECPPNCVKCAESESLELEGDR
jgi:hypothetical protein